jgi:hypothetical protein
VLRYRLVSVRTRAHILGNGSLCTAENIWFSQSFPNTPYCCSGDTRCKRINSFIQRSTYLRSRTGGGKNNTNTVQYSYILLRVVCTYCLYPTSPKQLVDSSVEGWNEIPLETVQVRYESIPRWRIETVGNTLAQHQRCIQKFSARVFSFPLP